jgi:hypothetical protein
MTDEHECSWCGEAGPLVDSDTQESSPVIAFRGITQTGQTEYFHEPCHDTLIKYNALRDAVKATGWSRETFLMNVDLLVSDLEEEGEFGND